MSLLIHETHRTERTEMIKHTAYANGTIRNAQGKLVAFYNADAKQLLTDGVVQSFFAETLEIAMEIVGERCN